MEIELPESFKRITGAFCDGFYEHKPDFRDVIRKALRRLSTEEREELRQFLAIVMNKRYFTEDRRVIWNRGMSSYYIIAPGHDEIYRVVVEELSAAYT